MSDKIKAADAVFGEYRRRIQSESPPPLYREVDPAHDAWVERLIELCETFTMASCHRCTRCNSGIYNHLQARPRQ